jgi:predicted phage tail protein
VTWAAAADATSYRLEESSNGGSWVAVYSGPVFSKEFTKAAGSYSYRISGCNAAGCSPVSAAKTVKVTLKPTAAPALSAPDIAHSGSYSLSWTAVATTTSYLLEENVNGAGWADAYQGAALGKALSGRTEGTYLYRVSACNAAGCGPLSASATTVVNFAPAPPTLSGPGTTDKLQFTLTWNSVAGATSYWLDTNSGTTRWTKLYSGTALSFAQAQPNYTTYGYRISACNAYGCGEPSATRNVTVSRDSGCTTCLAPMPKPRSKPRRTSAVVTGGGK